jgi:AbrB family looped-hinge helix DNA binding protein
MTSSTIQIRKKGNLTLPADIRAKYGLDDGDIFTLIDLGDGSFLLSPKVSEVNRLGNRVSDLVRKASLSTEDLLTTLDEEREQYYRDRYASK